MLFVTTLLILSHFSQVTLSADGDGQQAVYLRSERPADDPKLVRIRASIELRKERERLAEIAAARASAVSRSLTQGQFGKLKQELRSKYGITLSGPVGFVRWTGEPDDDFDVRTYCKENIPELVAVGRIDSAIKGILSPNKWAKTLQYGFLGKDRADYFDSLDVDSTGEMIALAFSYEVLSNLRKPMEKRLERSGEAIWGVIETPFIVVYNAARELWYDLFHKGRRPFNIQSVMSLRDETLEAMLNGLGAASEECMRKGPKGRDTVHRNVMDALMTDDERIEETVVARDRLWTRLVEGYSGDIDRISFKLEQHKRYYAEIAAHNSFGLEQDIVNLTTRVQESLILIKEEVLQPALSLKDVASGDNRLLFDHLIKDIKKRFALLINALRTYHFLPEDKESLASAPEKTSKPANAYGSFSGFAG